MDIVTLQELVFRRCQVGAESAPQAQDRQEGSSPLPFLRTPLSPWTQCPLSRSLKFSRLWQSAFCCCDKYLRKTGRKTYYGCGFGGFSPQSAGVIALGPVIRQKIMAEEHGREMLLTSWKAENRERARGRVQDQDMSFQAHLQ